jgi:hypothetical protein
MVAITDIQSDYFHSLPPFQDDLSPLALYAMEEDQSFIISPTMEATSNRYGRGLRRAERADYLKNLLLHPALRTP